MPYTLNPFTGELENSPSTKKGNSAYTTYKSNSASYATTNFVQNNFLPLSGGTLTGSLSISSTLNVLSSVYVSGDLEVHSGNIVTALYVEDGLVGINTETPNKELTVNGSISSNSSVYVSGDLEVHSGNIVTALYIEDGLVGINTETPNKELTVNGSISSNFIIYDKYSNSTKWSSVYTTVLNQSGGWVNGGGVNSLYLPLSGGTLIGTIIGNVSATGSFYGDGSKLTGIIAGDTVATTLVRSNSASWNSVYTTVSSNSANWVSISTLRSNYLNLTGGNLTGSVSLSTYSSNDALRITQSGTGNALVVEDSENLDSTPFIITSSGNVGIGTIPNEILTVIGNISATGTVFSNSNKCVTTIVTDTPGISAISTILAVSSMPLSPNPNILYIVI